MLTRVGGICRLSLFRQKCWQEQKEEKKLADCSPVAISNVWLGKRVSFFLCFSLFFRSGCVKSMKPGRRFSFNCPLLERRARLASLAAASRLVPDSLQKSQKLARLASCPSTRQTKPRLKLFLSGEDRSLYLFICFFESGEGLPVGKMKSFLSFCDQREGLKDARVRCDRSVLPPHRSWPNLSPNFREVWGSPPWEGLFPTPDYENLLSVPKIFASWIVYCNSTF